MSKFKKSPIGVFDSGLGGLTVVKELIKQLPYENIVYYGDTARVPYGTKSKESIVRFSNDNTKVLLDHNVKMVVVACNSSSSYALDELRKKFSVPFIGVIDPGSKKAVNVSKNKCIGVIATSATIASNKYQDTIKVYSKNAKVFSKACPLFVPIVEEGWQNKSISINIAEEYLKELKKTKIDALILGCTHYPLLKKSIKTVMGKNVFLIDSAKEVALAVKSILEETNMVNDSKKEVKYKFLVSDKPQRFKMMASNFLGRKYAEKGDWGVVGRNKS